MDMAKEGTRQQGERHPIIPRFGGRYPSNEVLGLLDSSRVTLAIVFGIPVAIGIVVALGIRRSTPALLLVAGSLVVAAIAVLAVWAVFQPGTGTAGSTASSPGGGVTSPPRLDFSCTPSGPRLQQAVQGIAYQKKCLAAPAGQPITIQFTNKDSGITHNIHIYSADPTADPNARSLFSGPLVAGPATATYRVPPLAAGRYFFHCDVHPTQMMGGFVVG
jgi:plastocyanin